LQNPPLTRGAEKAIPIQVAMQVCFHCQFGAKENWPLPPILQPAVNSHLIRLHSF
jgi:hypothetical protein